MSLIKFLATKKIWRALQNPKVFLSEDITKLKPYDFEPLASDTASDSDSSDHANYSITSPRVGNVEWCQCGNCKAMDTEVESLCCAEASEIPEEFFEG